MDTGCICCTKNGAKIVWILQLIQKDNKWRLISILGHLQNILQLCILYWSYLSQYTLMANTSGNTIQLTAVPILYIDTLVLGYSNDFLNRAFGAAVGNHQLVDTAAALQGFHNSIPPSHHVLWQFHHIQRGRFCHLFPSTPILMRAIFLGHILQLTPLVLVFSYSPLILLFSIIHNFSSFFYFI